MTPSWALLCSVRAFIPEGVHAAGAGVAPTLRDGAGSRP